jgi:hypothetical protein
MELDQKERDQEPEDRWEIVRELLEEGLVLVVLV